MYEKIPFKTDYIGIFFNLINKRKIGKLEIFVRRVQSVNILTVFLWVAVTFRM